MRKPIFNNRRVTRWMVKYSRHPDEELGEKIMAAIYPLIDAAITRKNLFHFRDDLRQECATKIFQGLLKYDGKRGMAFAFLWSTICNTIITHGERLSRPSLSLEDEAVHREAEIAAPIIFQSPEYQYLCKIVDATIEEAIHSDELRDFTRTKEVEGLKIIRQSILNEEVFSNREAVLKKLKRLDIGRKDGQFLINYVIVTLRSKLYRKKGDLLASADREAIQITSKVPSSRVL